MGMAQRFGASPAEWDKATVVALSALAVISASKIRCALDRLNFLRASLGLLQRKIARYTGVSESSGMGSSYPLAFQFCKANLSPSML
ncbi:MAG TPA: hypothetical protein VGQ88_04300 [Burkholderiales bacterium]|nr:hypothetical protein [Burkholderiales bacterium]